MRRKEAELNAALIQYAARCVAEGDEVALTDLGLDRRDAETIESFYLTDIDHLISLHFVLLAKGAMDRHLFHRLVEHVKHLREFKSVRDELLALDAPFPMMQEHVGMDSIEYAERGRRLKILRHNGRPTDPTEEEEAALLQALEALKIPSMQEGGLKDYLAVCKHKHTGLSARTVWTLGHRASARAPLCQREER